MRRTITTSVLRDPDGARASAGRFLLFAGFLGLWGASPVWADSDGHRSFANIEQISDLARARVQQVGEDNKVEVLQKGQDLTADIYVLGQLNKAEQAANRVVQTGENSAAEIVVIGDSNSFDILQEGEGGPANNYASTNTQGDFNALAVSQTNDFGDAFSNTATVSQMGVANTAGIRQEIDPRGLASGGNTASIEQDGDLNDARIEQTGADNSAAIEQTGTGNTGTVLQEGIGLSAVLAQTGSALNYTINQTGCVIASGCGAVTVTQTGP